MADPKTVAKRTVSEKQVAANRMKAVDRRELVPPKDDDGRA